MLSRLTLHRITLATADFVSHAKADRTVQFATE